MKRSEGKIASFAQARVGTARSGRSSSASDAPRSRRQAWSTSGIPVAFETNGTVRDARVRLEDMEAAVVERQLQVEQPARAEAAGERRRELADLCLQPLADRRRGQEAGRVAGVDTGALDVLDDRRHPALLAVAEHVDVELERAGEEAVDERGPIELELLRTARDAHPTAAEHVGGADEHRVTDPVRERARLGGRRRVRPRRRLAARSRASSPPKRPRSSARSIAPSGSPSSGTPASARPAASASGVWPPSETTTPSGRSSATTSSTRSSVTGSR